MTVFNRTVSTEGEGGEKDGTNTRTPDDESVRRCYPFFGSLNGPTTRITVIGGLVVTIATFNRPSIPWFYTMTSA